MVRAWYTGRDSVRARRRQETPAAFFRAHIGAYGDCSSVRGARRQSHRAPKASFRVPWIGGRDLQGGWAQLFLDAVDALSRRLTPQQRGLLLTLIGRLGRSDTIVRGGRYRTGPPLSVSDVARLMGWSRQYTSQQLAEIERSTGALRIMGEGPARYIEIAPSLAHRFSRHNTKKSD